MPGDECNNAIELKAMAQLLDITIDLKMLKNEREAVMDELLNAHGHKMRIVVNDGTYNRHSDGEDSETFTCGTKIFFCFFKYITYIDIGLIMTFIKNIQIITKTKQTKTLSLSVYI